MSPTYLFLYLGVVLLVLGVIVVGYVTTRRGGGVAAPPEAPEAPPAEGPPDVVEAPPPAVEAPPLVEAPPVVAPPPIAPPPVAPPVEASVAPPIEAPPAEAPPVVAAKPALHERLSRARQGFGQALVRTFRRGGLTPEDWEEVEAILLQADVGVAATKRIVDDLKAKQSSDGDLVEALRAELLAILGTADRSLGRKPSGLTIWLVAGVNGTGKTTTIGKLATQEAHEGRRVVLAAADTFRAAADEQLEVWAERSGAEVVKHAPGADPAAVAFDGVKAAKSRRADVLIVDTAGRLHTKRNLMEELGKIRRVVEREAGPPDEVLLVLDATTGQNGIQQARAFTETAGVTGIVLSKLDGTAKGGIVIGVQQELGLPVKLVGIGEGAEDLAPFDPVSFVDALIG
jgi:fused signal recognition particle receptor